MGRTIVVGVIAGVVIWLALRLARAQIGAALLRSFMRNRPRPQPIGFVLRLRDLFYRDPFAVMAVLFSEQRDAWARKVWNDAKPPPLRVGTDAGIPAGEISVHRTHLADGRAIAVIVLPPPLRKGEPYFVGIVLPGDAALETDFYRARQEGHLFYLNRGSSQSGRETDLCGWTWDGKQRWYNVGAPTDPDGFAAAVGAKLRELGK